MFYAVDIKTKEHRIIGSFLSDGEPALRFGEKVVEADADGWIKQRGGECPLSSNTRCDTRASYSSIVIVNRDPESVNWSMVGLYRPILESDTTKEKDSGSNEWGAEHLGYVTIEAEDSKGTAICVKDDYDHNHLCSKPINHERDSAIKQMSKDINHHTVESLFDDEPYMLAENLYDMGYRKVEGD